MFSPHASCLLQMSDSDLRSSGEKSIQGRQCLFPLSSVIWLYTIYKSDLHWRHQLNKCSLTGLLVLCVLSGLVGIAYLGFDPLVRSLILKKLVLSNTSDTFHIWEDPPISPHLKVYFFNLTNPEEVFNGVDLPRLVEVGPYTYKQQWLKQNVTWHNNGTISYRTRKIFT